MKYKVYFSWLLVVLWMAAIFWLSSMNSDLSTHRSMKTINKVIESTVETTNKIGITDKHPSEEKKQEITKKLNYPLRKCMHMGEYLILCLLLINAFYQSGIKDKKLIIFSILVCFLYACTDEFHQLFVGRTGQFSDVLIDTVGASIGVILYLIGYRIYNSKRNQIN